MDYNTPEKCARPPKMAETLHPCGEVEPFSLRGVLSTPKSPDLSPAEVLLKPLNAHASEFFPSQPTADAESWPRWWNWGAYEVWVLGFPALGLKVQEPGGGGREVARTLHTARQQESFFASVSALLAPFQDGSKRLVLFRQSENSSQKCAPRSPSGRATD